MILPGKTPLAKLFCPIGCYVMGFIGAAGPAVMIASLIQPFHPLPRWLLQGWMAIVPVLIAIYLYRFEREIAIKDHEYEERNRVIRERWAIEGEPDY